MITQNSLLLTTTTHHELEPLKRRDVSLAAIYILERTLYLLALCDKPTTHITYHIGLILAFLARPPCAQPSSRVLALNTLREASDNS